MLKAFAIFFLLLTISSTFSSSVKVHLVKVTGATEDDIQKLNKVSGIIEEILGSEEFKQRVLNFTFNGKKQFVDTTLSNVKVYESIMSGSEKYSPDANGVMDISLNFYYQNKNTIGYTIPNSESIFLNHKYYNTYDAYEAAGNIVHEWTHKLGFEHAKYWSTSRDYSVPYGIGYIVDDMAKDIKKRDSVVPSTIPVPEIPKPKICYRSWKTLWLVLKCE